MLIIASTSLSQKYLLPYRSGDLWGYADVNGNVIVEPKYDSVSMKNKNSRWNVFKNAFVGVIDAKGKELSARFLKTA